MGTGWVLQEQTGTSALSQRPAAQTDISTSLWPLYTLPLAGTLSCAVNICLHTLFTTEVFQSIWLCEPYSKSGLLVEHVLTTAAPVRHVSSCSLNTGLRVSSPAAAREGFMWGQREKLNDDFCADTPKGTDTISHSSLLNTSQTNIHEHQSRRTPEHLTHQHTWTLLCIVFTISDADHDSSPLSKMSPE